ncbi:hypothetical protein C8J57DRAFT_1229727 [Mycena rebaudengoi]|nr:hypothetical protein C8J57DRAFT_1229727 [Mycena rebaudengoi]
MKAARPISALDEHDEARASHTGRTSPRPAVASIGRRLAAVNCFPQNTTTRVESSYGPAGDYIHMFLAPSITSIDVRPRTDPDHSLFPALALKCPRLKDVSISPGDSALGLYTAAVPACLRELQCVESLYVDVLELQPLRVGPYCLVLNPPLPGYEHPPAGNTLVSPEARAFAVLREIILRCPDLKSTARFLECLSQISLEDFIYIHSMLELDLDNETALGASLAPTQESGALRPPLHGTTRLTITCLRSLLPLARGTGHNIQWY